MTFSVGELSKLTGVTVRTLHHYDEIGLVRPSARSRAGYRLYDDRDVLRLHQALLLRELGLPLEEIAMALDEEHEQPGLLRRHREVLLGKRARLDAMLSELDARLDALSAGVPMRPEEVKRLFDGFDPEVYAAEAEERWGESEEYGESRRRTERYTKADWERYKAAAGANGERLIEHMRRGTPVDDASVQELVEEHRLLIDHWFYPCSVAMHKRLGQIYVSDSRFAENLDRMAAGYAQYLSEAIASSRAHC